MLEIFSISLNREMVINENKTHGGTLGSHKNRGGSSSRTNVDELLETLSGENKCVTGLQRMLSVSVGVQRSLEDTSETGIAGCRLEGALVTCEGWVPVGPTHPRMSIPAPSGGRSPTLHGRGRGWEPSCSPFSRLGTSHKSLTSLFLFPLCQAVKMPVLLTNEEILV